MQSLPTIFNSDIIPQTIDKWWTLHPALSQLPATPVVAICSAEEKGEAEQALLQSIMVGGCKLNTGQYAVLLYDEQQPMAWAQIKTQLQPKLLILFGLHPSMLGVSVLFQFHTCNRFDGCLWLPVPSIKQLMSDKEVKRQLWLEALRPVFEEKKFGAVV
jgi:hypothetical protein